ncbi:Hypothetical_protein [Hexamita inflata]|uniref:Hypothetical_protein n=1 Tax=Hexamita inflata TaxID=28002 RepID=A0AA86TYS7_9EUKA|nr:Hypothetical protein HINF_LOCUS22500 [Hexamita inflata]
MKATYRSQLQKQLLEADLLKLVQVSNSPQKLKQPQCDPYEFNYVQKPCVSPRFRPVDSSPKCQSQKCKRISLTMSIKINSPSQSSLVDSLQKIDVCKSQRGKRVPHSFSYNSANINVCQSQKQLERVANSFSPSHSSYIPQISDFVIKEQKYPNIPKDINKIPLHVQIQEELIQSWNPCDARRLQLIQNQNSIKVKQKKLEKKKINNVENVQHRNVGIEAEVIGAEFVNKWEIINGKKLGL